MKKIFLIAFAIFSIQSVSYSQVKMMVAPSLGVQELWVKNDSTWSIDLFDPHFGYIDMSFIEQLDSIEFVSSSGRSLYVFNRYQGDTRLEDAKNFINAHSVLTFTNDSLENKLHINPNGDFIAVQGFTKEYGWLPSDYFQIKFGNIEDSELPALDSTKSILNYFYDEGTINRLFICDNPLMGSYNNSSPYAYINITGQLIDKNENLLPNKTFYLHKPTPEIYDFMINNVSKKFMINTDNLGMFNASVPNIIDSTITKIYTLSQPFEIDNTIHDNELSIKTVQLQKDIIIQLTDDWTKVNTIPQINCTVYPNPTSNVATIAYSLPIQNHQARLQITDSNGKLMESLPIGNSEGKQEIVFGDAYVSGIYTIQIVVNSEILSSQKIVVKK